MQQDSTRKWIACVVAASDGVLSNKFNQMVNAPGWSDETIDFRVTMNGVEFTNLDDMFDRLHKHYTEQNNKIRELEEALIDTPFDIKDTDDEPI
jgi:hypothetical protein